VTVKVDISERARADIARLVDFLATRDRRAAVRAVGIIDRALGSLAEFPNRGAPGPRTTYREIQARFGRGAYIIRYQVRPEGVLVTRLFHSNERRS
jgi:plasmid stabilization system protein ParE